ALRLQPSCDAISAFVGLRTRFNQAAERHRSPAAAAGETVTPEIRRCRRGQVQRLVRRNIDAMSKLRQTTSDAFQLPIPRNSHLREEAHCRCTLRLLGFVGG